MKCAKLRCDRKSDPMIPLRPLPLRRRTAAAVWLIIIQECHTQQQKRVGWEITNCYVGNDSGWTRWFLALRVESSRMIISSNHVQCMNVMLCNCCTMTSTKCQRIILGGRKYANKRRILFYYITILSAYEVRRRTGCNFEKWMSSSAIVCIAHSPCQGAPPTALTHNKC